MEDYDKNKESSYLNHWDENNSNGQEKLPVNNFESIEETSQFNKDFIKNYNEEYDEGHFLEIDVQYQKNYINLIMIYHFYQEE